MPGSEAAGVIEAVGAGVEDVKIGDRVAYTCPVNAHTSVRTVHADRLVRLPESLPDDLAASLMLKGLTAYYLINESFGAAASMTVLVQTAAGGVGLLLGRWLAARGVTAIGTAGGPEKSALAARNGYAHVNDYSAGNFGDRVMELTEGAGVHAVYDCVGRDTRRRSLACLRPRGTFICFGQASGPIEGFGTATLRKARSPPPARSYSTSSPTHRSFATAPGNSSPPSPPSLRSEIRQRYALTDVAAAHTDLESRRTAGPTILIP